MNSEENLIDFNKICRLCLMEGSVMSSIFRDDRNSDNESLSIRIKACVSIELDSIDGLPSQICTTCLCQVDGWFKFKNLCKTADEILKKYLRNEPIQLETISQIRSKAEEIKQIFTSSNAEYLTSAVREAENYKSVKSSQNSNFSEDKLKLLSLLKTESRKSVESVLRFENSLKRELKKNCVSENLFESEFTGPTDSSLVNSFVHHNNAQIDDLTSDDDLTLSEKQRKILQKTLKSSIVKTKKRNSDDTASGTIRHSRTIKMQTDGEHEETVEVIETNLGDFLPLNSDKKKIKSRKTQTPPEHCSTKRRFRIRPAIPSSCTLCDKVYKNSEILRQHMKSHHVTGTIECLSCKLTFTSVRSLKYHEQRKHSNLEPVPCTFCGKKFLDKKYLRIHENIHSQTNHFVCQFCGRKFIMKTNLTVHISRHHTKKSNDFICQICGKAFPFKLYLKKHFKTHTDYKPHQCNYCEAKFRENTLLRKHVNSIHLKLRPFLCQYCHKTFTRSLYLREHVESQHLGIQRKVECSRCGGTFQNRNRLRHHECVGRMEVVKNKIRKKIIEKGKHKKPENFELNKNINHASSSKIGNEKHLTSNREKKRKLNYFDVTYDDPVPTKNGKIHQCRICQKYLKNVTTRNRHELENHPPPLPCEFCQKSFTTILTYQTHRNIHLGLTKYKCQYCGKHLASRSNLEDHEKVHTKEKPIHCPQCDKAFSSTSNLRVHLKFHAGLKAYFCHICGKGHVTVGNLKLHMKRHFNEKNHVCHICGKGFNGKSELKKHIESHDTVKKYCCEYCFQKLKTASSLRRHVNIQHLKIRPYKCHLCLRDFGRRENLREHMQAHTENFQA